MNYSNSKNNITNILKNKNIIMIKKKIYKKNINKTS